MRRYVVIVSLAVLLLSVQAVPVFAQSDDACVPAAGEVLQIGAVFPERVLMSANAADPLQGAQAMVAALNACGGVNGRPVELLLEPALNRQEAEEAAAVLVEAGVPLILGSGSLAVSEVLDEVATSEEIVYWEVSEAVDVLGAWTFSPRPNSRQLGETAVAYLHDEVLPHLERESMRVALVFDDGPRGTEIAAGVRASLDMSPIIEYGYSGEIGSPNRLAVDIREQNIDVVILAAFNTDADRLWYALRQADANLEAWVHVGNAGFRRNLCRRFGNNDGILSVSATGPVSRDYRESLPRDVQRLYRLAYNHMFNDDPTMQADLSASGVFMLLHHVLPDVDGAFTPESIRAAIMESTVTGPAGLMGEGLSFTDSGLNARPGVIVQQRQEGLFCTAWPDALATCFSHFVTFPTWRERAILEESGATCNDPL